MESMKADRRSSAFMNFLSCARGRDSLVWAMPRQNAIDRSQGIAVAPHALAAESALSVMRDGGDAIEAMVAAAATIAVVYPHMNSIGGDAYWLIHVPREGPRAIDASGAAARRASIQFYRERGLAAIP